MSLDPLYTAVSWVLLRWHSLFTAIGLPADGGLNWALSIVFLVVTARVLLFRFFIKQVHYQRRMQTMQPKIKKLQEKHKGDKATLQREMMALQQAEGFNPISGCLPMFLQLPIFISLFHVLKHMSAAVAAGYPEHKKTLYGFTKSQLYDAAHAKLFNAPLAASLRESSDHVTHVLGGSITATRLVIAVVVVISAGATLITQRAVIANATTPAEGQAATIQRLMMFGIPASVFVSGLFFPIGVLLYWFTSNLWTMAQQFYILKYHPDTRAATVTAEAEQRAASARAAAPRPGARPGKNVKRRTVPPPPADGASAKSPTVGLTKPAQDATTTRKSPTGKTTNGATPSGPLAEGLDASSSNAAGSNGKTPNAAGPNGKTPNAAGSNGASSAGSGGSGSNGKPPANGAGQRNTRTASSRPSRAPNKKRR